MSTIFEILESNQILTGSEDFGLIVTVNGSYFQLWRQGQKENQWECLDAYSFSSRIESRDGLYGADSVKVLECAEEILRNATTPEEEQGDK
jgi:hypothetical protein